MEPGDLRTLSLLVHGDSKVGKTTFVGSMPKPGLILDVEGGTKFLPYRLRQWDPLREAPPTPDGTWDFCVVIVRDWQTVTTIYQWLNSGQHHFESVAIDSISEVQKRCKDVIAATGAMSQQLWGELLTHMELIVRQFRDLTTHPIRPVRVVVITAFTTERGGKWRPYVQGQLGVTLPYFMDVIGYLKVEEVAGEDPTQPATPRRLLWVSPHPFYEAGERVQGRLGAAVWDPDVMTMLRQVYPKPQVAA